jgi:streptogramin lyase
MYPVPDGYTPQGIAAGPDGALWFAEYGKTIGRITTAGVITEFPVPTGGGLGPNQIAAGPDGALWFTCPYSQIGRITTAGAVSLYPVSKGSYPEYITAAPDGALWFTELAANQIGRITTAGVVTEYPIPTANSQPIGITVGPDDALWFTESAGNKIGRITGAGAITEYAVPVAASSSGVEPYAIVTGPDGGLWFSESRAGEIGQVVFTTANLSVTPDSGDYGSELTFSGSGFAPNENVRIYDRGVGSPVLASATADAGGAFTASAPAPPSPYGPRVFLGEGQSCRGLGAASFSTAARLALQPASGTPGATVTAVGHGFGMYENVVIYWGNSSTQVGSGATGADGGFTVAIAFTVPPGAAAGVSEVLAVGLASKAVARKSFTVE